MKEGRWILSKGLLLLSFVLGTGCGSTQPPQAEVPPAAPPPAATKPSPSVNLETKTDTIRTVREHREVTDSVTGRQPVMRFTVQIGAFKNPHNATELQRKTREGYNLPVLNDFDKSRGLYRIRIGVFESKESARVFCEQLRKDSPEDYADCWVVELR